MTGSRLDLAAVASVHACASAAAGRGRRRCHLDELGFVRVGKLHFLETFTNQGDWTVRRLDRSRYDISSDRTFAPEDMDSNDL